MKAGPYTDFALYRRLLRQAQPYWLHIVSIFLISLLAAPLALLNPLPHPERRPGNPGDCHLRPYPLGHLGNYTVGDDLRNSPNRLAARPGRHDSRASLFYFGSGLSPASSDPVA